MRSAHGAGFLYGLAELGITDPDIIIGTSGNAGNVLYYVSRQYDNGSKVWCGGLLSTRKFVSYLRFWRIVNIGVLFPQFVFQKPMPRTKQL